MRAPVLAFLVLLGACSPDRPAPVPTRTIRDWRGKDVAVPVKPERIVSIVPSCTELLFAAGAGAQVVGVTTYCDYPEEAKTRAKIGNVKVNYEMLLSLRPDLVVSDAVLAKSATETIEGMGIPVFSVTPADLPDIAKALRVLGDVTGHAEEAGRAARDVETRIAAVEARVAGKPRPVVCLELTPRPDVAVPGTYGHDVIVRAGGRNAFEELSNRLFVPVSWEAVVAKNPEVYVVAHDDAPRPDERPGFPSMRAARDKRYHVLDKRWFTYPTPRLVRGLELLAEKLHP
jgi:iron complex transport system substrate-binding protein